MNPTLNTEIQNGTVTTTVPLHGGGVALHYRSDRVPGYRPDDTVEIHITGSEVPEDLVRAELEIEGDNGTRTEQFPPRPDQRTQLSADDYDRPPEVRLGYVYRGAFEDEAERREYEAGLGGPDGGPTVTYDDERHEVTIWRERTPQFAGDTWALLGLTGWTLDVHHDYVPEAGVCRLGDGMTRELSATDARSNATSDAGVTTRDDEVFHVPAEDATTLFTFDADGRHRRTVDTLTDTTRRTFEYEQGSDRLLAIGDDAGQRVALEYDGDVPTAFVHGDDRLDIDVKAGLIQQITTNQGTIKLEYAAGGLLTAITDALERITRVSYDDTGRVTTRLDPWGRTTSFVRTETDEAVETRVISPTLREYRYRVEGDGADGRRLYNECCGVGAETHDAADGSTSISYPDGTSARVARGEDPRFEGAAPVVETAFETSSGRRLGATVDRSVETDTGDGDRVTEVVTARFEEWTERIVYDVGERMVRTDAHGLEHGIAFDDAGRPSVIDPPGRTPLQLDYTDDGLVAELRRGEPGLQNGLSLSYDDSGRVASVRDGSDRERRFTYDDHGRVTATTDGTGATVEFEFDAAGNLADVTPPGRAQHTLEYGPGDRLTAYRRPAIDGDRAETTFEYDQEDALRRVRTPDDTTVEFEYDSAGRRQAIRTDRYVRYLEYDAATGELTGIATDDDGAVGFEYDGPLLTRQSWSGPVNGTVEYDYDGRRLAAVWAAGETVGYEYDAGRLRTAGDLHLSYDDASGAIDATTIGRIEESWTHNCVGDIDHYTAAGAEAGFELEYEYDGAGRTQEITETIDGTTETRGFKYDEAGRLARVLADGDVRYRFEYDANGNRTRVVGPDGATTAEYDARDRLVCLGEREYDHTASGYRCRETAPEGRTAYDYDQFGSLRSVALPDGREISYAVDAANRRVAREVDGTVTRRFLYRDALNPVAELDADGALRSRFVYATRENVPDYMVREGRRYRILTDHRGSPRLVVDVDTGGVAQRMDYGPYGRVLRDTNPGFQPFGFAGGIYDHATGLVRFGARDYDAYAGRWTAPDPIGFAGGDPNLYAYVGGDPVNHVDETGELAPLALIAAPLILGAISGLGAAAGSAVTYYGKYRRIDCTFVDMVATSYASTTIGTFAGRWLTPYGGVAVTQVIEDSLAQSRFPPDVSVTKLLTSIATGAAAGRMVRNLEDDILTDILEDQLSNLMALWVEALTE